MSRATDLINRLLSCPLGTPGWKEFEDVCTEILKYLFVPPLQNPRTQARTYSGIDRRDAIFPNRNFTHDNNWGILFHELGARLILFEFKNYDTSEIGKDEVIQTLNYMSKPMGNLSFIICTKKPDESAHIKRNSIYGDQKKAILFITKEQLLEMIYIKERGEDPSDFLMDLLESFYIEYE